MVVLSEQKHREARRHGIAAQPNIDIDPRWTAEEALDVSSYYPYL